MVFYEVIFQVIVFFLCVLKARKRLNQIVGEIICERKEKKMAEKDLLGRLLKFKDSNGQILTEEQIADNIIGVLFAAHDTTAAALTWIVKYLHENRRLLEAVKVRNLPNKDNLRNYHLVNKTKIIYILQAEQMAIREANIRGNKSLTWTQTRNMPLTFRVRKTL